MHIIARQRRKKSVQEKCPHRDRSPWKCTRPGVCCFEIFLVSWVIANTTQESRLWAHGTAVSSKTSRKQIYQSNHLKFLAWNSLSCSVVKKAQDNIHRLAGKTHILREFTHESHLDPDSGEWEAPERGLRVQDTAWHCIIQVTRVWISDSFPSLISSSLSSRPVHLNI